MYETLDISDLFQKAEEFILLNDRMLYKDYIKTIEEFCTVNEVVIGGDIGIKLLLGEPLDINCKQWVLYTTNAYMVSKNLTDKLYETKIKFIDDRLIKMRTNIKHRDFTIFANMRDMVRVFDTTIKHGGHRIATVGKNGLVDAYFTNGYFSDAKVPCLPPIIQLINIYRLLYKPSEYTNWAELVNISRKLFTLYNVKDVKCIVQKRRNFIDKVIQVSDKLNPIYVGEVPFDTIVPSKVQFISSWAPEDIAKYYEHTLGKVKHYNYQLNIPIDFQIEKNSFFLDNQHIADVYNSTSYELIPFMLKTINGRELKVAGYFAQMRFLFIDHWVDYLKERLGKLQKNNTIYCINILYKIIDHLLLTPNLVFVKDYMGVNINEMVMYLKSIQSVNVKKDNVFISFEYYPARPKLDV